MIKKTTALLLFAALAVSSGCAGQNGNAASPAPTTPPVILQPTPTPAPVKGGTLRLPMPVNADKSDPLRVNTEEMLILYSLVFESLLIVDMRGQLAPGLAENWSCDETGAVWTIKLRSAARWQDTGASVTAADVVQSFNRIVSLGTASYYAYAVKRVKSMEAAEDGSLVVTMKQPGLASLYALTFPVTESASTATGNYPAGTGPFQFSYVSDDTVRLARNDNWWKQAPNLEFVEFYARESNDISLASYAAGQLDMVFTSSLTVGRYRDDANTTVLDMMTQNVEVMLVNFANENLRELRVRQAIAYAIDRSRIITNVYMNRARASDVPVPPDSWLYESKSAVYDYNTEVALALLKEAGWQDVDEDGFLEKNGYHYDEMTLTLLVNDSTDAVRKTAAEQIKAQLEAIGIHVELVTAAYALGNEESEYIQKLRSGAFDLALAGFNLGFDCSLAPYLSGSGARNYGGYSNAGIEQLVANLNTAATEGDYIAAASALQMAFVEELPFITLYFRLNSVLYNSDIIGIAEMREPDVLRGIASWYASAVE
ncbi:MAG TPA: peptide ABC transporter substrate-binding protein [Clostridia bacterium]|nr:peptide ABC transporter substrate-binding protein [Clostridia bacterium]